MKKLIRVFSVIFILINISAYSQNKYTGYKPLSTFNRDTVKYLQYNWGLKAAGMCSGMKLSEFFLQFQPQIKAVEFSCAKWNGTYQVFSIRIYTITPTQIEQARNPAYSKNKLDLNKYSLYILFPYETPDLPANRPLWSDLKRTIPALKEQGKTLVPWVVNYKTLLGKYKVLDIQYNYGVFPELK